MTGNPLELFRKFFGAVRAIFWLWGSFLAPDWWVGQPILGDGPDNLDRDMLAGFKGFKALFCRRTETLFRRLLWVIWFGSGQFLACISRNCPKWLDEGAKGALTSWRDGLPRVSCTSATLFCTSAALSCTRATGF